MKLLLTAQGRCRIEGNFILCLFISYNQKKSKIGFLTSGITSFLIPGLETVGMKVKWHCCHYGCS